MGQVQYGHLYWENYSKVSQNTYRQKSYAILLLKVPKTFCYPIQKLREANLKISILLRYGSSSVIPQQSEPKHLYTNSLCNTIVKMSQEFCHPIQKLRKENLKLPILLSFFLLLHHVLTQKPKLKGHIWTFYMSNECSATKEVPLLGWSIVVIVLRVPDFS